MIDTDFYLTTACDMGEQHALRTRSSSARSEIPVLVERVEEHHP